MLIRHFYWPKSRKVNVFDWLQRWLNSFLVESIITLDKSILNTLLSWRRICWLYPLHIVWGKLMQQLYGHLPSISKTIQIRQTRHSGQCWRSKKELISDVLLLTPSHRRASVGRPARTYQQKLCTDTGSRLEDKLEAMDDGDEWRERVWEIRASCNTWWWWSLAQGYDPPLWNRGALDSGSGGVAPILEL